MEKNIIESAIWAFAKKKQIVWVVNTVSKLPDSDDRDKILAKLSQYYRQQINPRELSKETDWADALSYLDMACEMTNNIHKWENRKPANREIIDDMLNYLKKPQAPIDELVKRVYKMVEKTIFQLEPKSSNRLLADIKKAYLAIPGLEGEEIVRIAKRFYHEHFYPDRKFVEMEKLIPVFITRGDYKALRAIYEHIGKLGIAIVKRGEEVVHSCLKRGKIDEAKSAIFFIHDKGERLKYCELLGVNCDSLEDIRYAIE